MAKNFVVVAGHSVANLIDDLRSKMVRPSTHTPGTFDSKTLCDFQRLISTNGFGFVEAEIVASNYGYSLRFASGLQNFGLIRSSRNGEVDGSYAGALVAAEKWQAQEPTKRYVTFTDYAMGQREAMDAIAEQRKVRA